jgi:hypothetical protein
MAEENAGAGREQQEEMEEIERTFREDIASQDEAPRAIIGKEEFLSEELKEFPKEVKELYGLAAGQLAKKH